MDGKYLRGAKRPDGSRVFVLSAVRHGDGVTLASREIGAKTNEIPEFAPLLDQIDDTDLAGTVVTADALHAQRDHATYLHERGAHYLLTIKNNQRGQARQLHALSWKDIPVIHRDDPAATSNGSSRSSPSRACSFRTRPRSCGSSAVAVSTVRKSGPAVARTLADVSPAEPVTDPESRTASIPLTGGMGTIAACRAASNGSGRRRSTSPYTGPRSTTCSSP